MTSVTPTTYMVVYCITVWASAWATESRGLRPVALLASGAAALGAGVKVNIYCFNTANIDKSYLKSRANIE